MGIKYAHCSNVRYSPSTCFVLVRYSLACSSDQKKYEFLQYASMMVCSVKFAQSISGIKTNGFAPFSRTENCMLLSIVRCSSRSQCLHMVSTSIEIISSLNRPCTKGVAITSSAQAPYRRSPEKKLNLCGVVSTVTG